MDIDQEATASMKMVKFILQSSILLVFNIEGLFCAATKSVCSQGCQLLLAE